MLCNYRNREKGKTSKMKFFLLKVEYLFWPAKVEYDVHFRRPWSENLNNLEKTDFFQNIENIWYGGRVSLRQAAMGLAQHPRRFTSYHVASPNLRFGPEKLNNSSFFATGGYNTLEFISNWNAEVFFFI